MSLPSKQIQMPVQQEHVIPEKRRNERIRNYFSHSTSNSRITNFVKSIFGHTNNVSTTQKSSASSQTMNNTNADYEFIDEIKPSLPISWFHPRPDLRAHMTLVDILYPPIKSCELIRRPTTSPEINRPLKRQASLRQNFQSNNVIRRLSQQSLDKSGQISKPWESGPSFIQNDPICDLQTDMLNKIVDRNGETPLFTSTPHPNNINSANMEWGWLDNAYSCHKAREINLDGGESRYTSQPNVTSDYELSNTHDRVAAIKAKIIAEWERSSRDINYGKISAVHSTQSSLSHCSGDEPQMVDDELMSIPSPNLRVCFSPIDDSKLSSQKPVPSSTSKEESQYSDYYLPSLPQLKISNLLRQGSSSQVVISTPNIIQRYQPVPGCLQRNQSFTSSRCKNVKTNFERNKFQQVHLATSIDKQKYSREKQLHISENARAQKLKSNIAQNKVVVTTFPVVDAYIGHQQQAASIIDAYDLDTKLLNFSQSPVYFQPQICSFSETPQSAPTCRRATSFNYPSQNYLPIPFIAHPRSISSYQSSVSRASAFSLSEDHLLTPSPTTGLPPPFSAKSSIRTPAISRLDHASNRLNSIRSLVSSLPVNMNESTNNQFPHYFPENYSYEQRQHNCDSFINDSIDLGEAGRLNFRTGSFLGRYHENIKEIKQRNNTLELKPPVQQLPAGYTLRDYILRSEESSSDIASSPVLDDAKPTRMRSETRHKTMTLPTNSADLDPILALLQSDVNQLDNFRNTFRDHGVQGSNRLSVSPSKGPIVSEKQIKNKPKDNVATSSEETNIDKTQKSLNNQIHELIEIEFKKDKRNTSNHQTLPKEKSPTSKSCFFLSSKSLNDAETIFPKKPDPKMDKSKTLGIRPRHHPSRWSTMEKWRTPRCRPISANNCHQLTTDDSTKPPTENDSASSLLPNYSQTRIKMLIRPNMGTIPLWELCAGQLGVLRKIAQGKLTATQASLCPPSRQLKPWFFKSRNNSILNRHAQVDKSDSYCVENEQIQCKNDQIIASSPKMSPSPFGHSELNSFWPDTDCTPDFHPDNGINIKTNSWFSTRTIKRPFFGRSLAFWQRCLGHPYPPCIINMFSHLQKVGHTVEGIFRRAGGKIRIHELREKLETDIHWSSFDEWQPWDVADLLKQFFRELPECILTNHISSILIDIYLHSPKSCNLSILRWAIIDLPDENRIALQTLLKFLNDLTKWSSVTQMTEINLATCMVPSLFHFSKPSLTAHSMSPMSLSNFSPRRRRNMSDLTGEGESGSETREVAELQAAKTCLGEMITHALSLFEVAEDTLEKVHSETDYLETPRLSILVPMKNWDVWLREESSSLINECSIVRNKSGWTSIAKEVLKLYTTESGAGELLTGFEIYYKKPTKHCELKKPVSPLRTWRCSINISNALAEIISDKIWNERVAWDENVLRAEVMEEFSGSVQMQRILFNGQAPQPGRECRLLRGRTKSTRDNGGIVSIVSKSVNYGVVVPEAPQALLPSAHIFKEHFLVEPLSRLKSCRVTMLSEADMKGYSAEWYIANWGHLLLRRLLALRHSLLPLNPELILTVPSLTSSTSSTNPNSIPSTPDRNVKINAFLESP